MKDIIFILGSTVPKTGGELYNYKIFNHINEQNVVPHIYLIDLEKYKYVIRLRWVPILGDLAISLFLTILLSRYNGIFIEDHYFSRYLLMSNIFQKIFFKSKIVTLVHLFCNYSSDDGSPLRKEVNKQMEKIHLSQSDEIVTSSQHSSYEIQSLGVSEKHIHVFTPGIDKEKFSKLPRRHDDKLNEKILCVANYIPRKGILYLIQAFHKVESHGFTLHLVGNRNKSFSYYRKMNSLVDKLELRESVYFHDGKDQENLKYLYSTSDIFVLPSLKETFGIVLIEAMYYSLPVITVNSSAMPDLIADGVNGLLVPPQDSGAISRSLECLISQPELRRKMGDAGYQIASSSFDWDRTCSAFHDFLKEI